MATQKTKARNRKNIFVVMLRVLQQRGASKREINDYIEGRLYGNNTNKKRI